MAIHYPCRGILVVLAAAAVLNGCAIYEAQQHRSRLQTASEDNAHCQKQGFHYPQERYVSCRLKLYDERRRTQFMRVRMMERASQSPGGVPDTVPERPYTPVAPENFECHEASEGDTDYIFCSEKDAGGP